MRPVCMRVTWDLAPMLTTDSDSYSSPDLLFVTRTRLHDRSTSIQSQSSRKQREQQRDCAGVKVRDSRARHLKMRTWMSQVEQQQQKRDILCHVQRVRSPSHLAGIFPSLASRCTFSFMIGISRLANFDS
ncbi:hypothetical protein F441_07263 [Phytophthora nicotianae CJ01A1]|uniref:Uncharacterized protein n=1 Tax=Phytophthora nicotianae CJ01A1 TaxID=1317063 RepID=W2X9D3_PHYNI|nr:hypothetical protein F441_07263 [Phytophthora nicotianae CJ01A1]